MLVSIQHMTKSYGEKQVLQDINASVEDRDRIGLIGLNGAGKSTLIRLICGIEEPDEGEIIKRRDLSIGYLEQNAGLQSNSTIWDEMMRVFSHLIQMEESLRELEARIASKGGVHDTEYEALSLEYAQRQQHFENLGGYLTEVKAKSVLNGMGFSDKDAATRIDTLSGGERTRLALAKLLLEEPDILILDEPTNHLDFKTLMWLEGFLADYKGALLVVSHDRYFLDKTVKRIFEIEDHLLSAYPGNYSKYTLLKEEKLVRQQKEYEQLTQKAEEMRVFVEKNIVRATSSTRAKSKLKALERLREEIPDKPVFERKRVKFRFDFDTPTVQEVLHVKGMSLAVGQGESRKTLFTDMSLDVRRQERIAIIGSNGVGKSSFLKAIQGLLPYDAGDVDWGKHVRYAYYDQENAGIHTGNTVLEELWSRHPTLKEQDIRTMLGRVLLTGDNVYKKVGVISGGERAKLFFAIIMMERANVLILDEPTNHLDLNTKENLEKALLDFEGTLLFVSHDRYFLNRIPTRIVEITDDGIFFYEGNFDAYLEKQQELELARTPAAIQVREKKARDAGFRTKRQRSDEARRKKQLQEMEERIHMLEQEVKDLEEAINTKEVYQDYALMSKKCEILEQKRAEVSSLTDEWLLLSEE